MVAIEGYTYVPKIKPEVGIRELSPALEPHCQQFLINMLLGGYEIKCPDGTLLTKDNAEEALVSWQLLSLRRRGH